MKLILKPTPRSKKIKEDTFNQYMEENVYSNYNVFENNYIFKELNNKLTLEILNKSSQPLFKEDIESSKKTNLFFQFIISVDYWFIENIISSMDEDCLTDEYIEHSCFYILYGMKKFMLEDIDLWISMPNFIMDNYIYPYEEQEKKYMFGKLMDDVGASKMFFTLIENKHYSTLDYKELIQSSNAKIKKELYSYLKDMTNTYNIMRSLVNLTNSGWHCYNIDFSVLKYFPSHQ